MVLNPVDERLTDRSGNVTHGCAMKVVAFVRGESASESLGTEIHADALGTMLNMTGSWESNVLTKNGLFN